MTDNRKIRICHFSGKRGGFGALTRTLGYIHTHPKFELQLVVADMHTSDVFGHTSVEVEKYLPISATIDMSQKGGTASERTEALGECVRQCARVFESLAPDALLVIGDRGEVLAAVFAAVNLGIPVFHLEGGDTTGNLDDSFRHAITKLSHVHLTTNEETKARIIKMGEAESRVHVVGDVHLDRIKTGQYTQSEEVCARFGVEPHKYALLIQHSVTTEPQRAAAQIEATLQALTVSDLPVIAVYPCSDQGYEAIVSALEARRGEKNFQLHSNIDAPDFLGLLSTAAVLVGNSSSGIKEAPLFTVPTVNIGSRQEGRFREASVIDVADDTNAEAISEALTRALDVAWRDEHLGAGSNFYGDGKTAEHIIAVLEKTDFGPALSAKRLTY